MTLSQSLLQPSHLRSFSCPNCSFPLEPRKNSRKLAPVSLLGLFHRQILGRSALASKTTWKDSLFRKLLLPEFHHDQKTGWGLGESHHEEKNFGKSYIDETSPSLVPSLSGTDQLPYWKVWPDKWDHGPLAPGSKAPLYPVYGSEHPKGLFEKTTEGGIKKVP